MAKQKTKHSVVDALDNHNDHELAISSQMEINYANGETYQHTVLWCTTCDAAVITADLYDEGTTVENWTVHF